MTISARMIADSVSDRGIRMTTMELRYPRSFIHEEFLTHRALSRNASSSRAIPVERMIRTVLEDPAMPVFWGKAQKGMQAYEEMDEPTRRQVEALWLDARDQAVNTAQTMNNLGAHKQFANLVLRPWEHITVVCSSTNWANFFALRRHHSAKPEFRALADTMWAVMSGSRPITLRHGEWHLPYVHDYEIEKYGGRRDPALVLRKISTARCARTSYKTHDGRETTLEEDIALHGRLTESVPPHASPMEHQATPDIYMDTSGWDNEGKHGNLFGFVQYRKTLPNECVREAV